MIVASATSCNQPNELPPLNEGYATTVIVPDPEELTSEDREYIEEVQNEYDEAIGSN